jgi:sugar phosphate isomerase/epimerase
MALPVVRSMSAPQLTRRSILQGMVALPAMALAGAPALSSGQDAVPTAKWAKQIGMELYTVRDLMERDFDGTLSKLAALGYREVEPANGYNNMSPKDFRAMLDRHGLSAPSTHSGPTVGDGLEKELEGFQIMGIQYTSLPSPPTPVVPGRKRGTGMLGAYLGGHNSFTQAEAFGPKQLPISLDEAQRRAAELNKYGKIANKFGIKMLVHNHTGEFMPLTDAPQRTEYDVYLKETDPRLVAMQIDLGWATIAGQDVPAMFKANPGRYELWHIKDVFGIRNLNTKLPPVERIDAATFEPYGVGQIDYKPFFDLAEVAGLKHFCLEQDNAATWGDSLAAAGISVKNLQAMLTTGKVPGALYNKTDPYYRDSK